MLPSPSPSVMLYWAPRKLKYTSKTVSKARQWELFFTNVAPRAYLNASRSSRGMCCNASMASKFSVRLTGRPAFLSSTMNPDRRSSMGNRNQSSDSSLAAFAMSDWYFKRMCKVSLACSASMLSIPKRTNVRAQSKVSETEGDFLRSS